MKKFALVTLIMICVFNANAQYEFIIDSVIVDHIKVKSNDDLSTDDYFNGPELNIHCQLINKSTTEKILYPSRANTSAIFNFQGDEYINIEKSINLQRYDSILFIPNQSVTFVLHTLLVFNTRYFKNMKEDYTRETLQALPTLRIFYNDFKTRLYSTQIKKVIIRDWKVL